MKPYLNVKRLCLSVVAVAVAGLAGSAWTQTSSSTGEELYHEYACFGCHGYNGTGTTPLANKDSGILLSEPGFITFLRMRAELNPVLPSTKMPNYSADSLSDEDARKIYAYIRSLDDNPPAVEDIPVMQKILEAAQ